MSRTFLAAMWALWAFLYLLAQVRLSDVFGICVGGFVLLLAVVSIVWVRREDRGGVQ